MAAARPAAASASRAARASALGLPRLPADVAAVEHRVRKARTQEREGAGELRRVHREHRAALGPGPPGQLGRAAEPDEAPFVHEAQTIAVRGLVHVVGGDQHRDPVLVGQQVHEIPELAAGERVHARGRLVEEQHAGLVQDRAGEGEPLAHPERQRPGLAVGEALEPQARRAARRCGPAARPAGCRRDRRTGGGSPARSDPGRARSAGTCSRCGRAARSGLAARRIRRRWPRRPPAPGARRASGSGSSCRRRWARGDPGSPLRRGSGSPRPPR